MNYNDIVGKRIKQQREKLKYKQIDIANALQISPQAVSKWENGENSPDISLLVPLAKLLNVSTDWLLGYYKLDNNIEASVFISSIKSLTHKMQNMKDEEAVIWMNGFLNQITESVLKHDGIPVKYLGGGFIGFFTGPDHQRRSILASILAKKTVTEELTIGLHSGNIFVSTIGHKDYSSKDISGNTVNIAFRILSCNSSTGIISSLGLVKKAKYKNISNQRIEHLKGIDQPIEICDVIFNN